MSTVEAPNTPPSGGKLPQSLVLQGMARDRKSRSKLKQMNGPLIFTKI